MTAIPITHATSGDVVALSTVALGAAMTVDLANDPSVYFDNTDAADLTITVQAGSGPAASSAARAWTVPAGTDAWLRLPDSSRIANATGVATLALTTTGSIAGTAAALASA